MGKEGTKGVFVSDTLDHTPELHLLGVDDKYGKVYVERPPRSHDQGQPLFILLAKDKLSVIAISYYHDAARQEGAPEEFLSSLYTALNDFEQWAAENPGQMKVPD